MEETVSVDEFVGRFPTDQQDAVRRAIAQLCAEVEADLEEANRLGRGAEG